MQVLSKIVRVRSAVVGLALLGVLIMAGCGGSSTSSNATATPSFSPGGGTYNTSQTVTISSATSGAVLYCTTDGTTPTTSSPKCSNPTTVFKSEYLQAIAVAPGKSASAVASAGYTIDLNAVSTPTFSPAGGTYTSVQSVTIADATTGANIRYTTDGSVPTASSTLYTGAITVSASETLSAIAVATGYNNSGVASATYTIVPPAAAPTFSPAGGPYTSAQSVTIADTTPGAVIYYTTDGTPATATSTPYTSPVSVTQSETINAIAVASGYSSTTASAIYSINLQQALAPTFTLSNNQLTIGDATAGATIYYTTDGTQPSASSALHGAAPLTITVTAGETVKAIAVATGYATSTVATYTVSLSAASQPTFSLSSNSQLTISDATAGATIYYTTDGTQPSVSSTLHGAAPLTIAVTAGQTVNALAVASGYTNSAVATYAVTAAPTPSFSLTGSQLTINDTTAGATIYYTTDGTQPSASSPLHGAAPVTITVTGGEAVNAIAIAANYVSSTVGAFTARAAQMPSFSLVGSQLTISDATTGATIYYTIDGTQPTTSSPLSGSSPITITVTGGEAVNAIAAAPNYLNSVVENYTVGVTGTPEFSLSGGNLTMSDATSGAVIYYTINGSAPTTSSPLHGTAPVTVAVSIGDVVQAIALATGNTVSAPASYTVKATAATPQITPNGGYVLSSQLPISVSITEASSATVYYTTDGTTPSATNGTAYSTSFTVTPTASSPTVTVKAIAVGSNYNDSAEADSTFTLLASPAISGQVVSGSTPISGATVQLYAAGTTGYPGSASYQAPGPLSIVGNLTTDANGNFALSYTCPAATTSGGDLLYLVATKDISGDGSNKVRLMTALGSCNSSSFPSTATVNEVTTVASAYALSAFAKVDTTNGGIDIGAPATKNSQATTCDASDGWLSSAPETCNYNGLKNAFAAANNLVDPATGTARSFTPAYTQNLASDTNILNNSTVPTTRINALADMLATCVESDGSGCASGLFADASTSTATTTTTPNVPNVTPKDTLQAALNIAQNPGNNVSALLGLVSSTAPYNTGTLLTQTTQPTDLTLALTYTGAGLGIAPKITLSDKVIAIMDGALAIDASGNIWVAAYLSQDGQNADGGEMLAEFNALGAPVTSATKLSSDTKPVPNYGGYNPEPGKTTNGYGLQVLAIDPSGYLWTFNGVYNFLEINPDLSVQSTIIARSGEPNADFAIDSSGDVWFTASSNAALQELLASGVYGVVGISYFGDSFNSLAFDSNGGIWGSGTNSNGNDIFQFSTSTGNVAYDAFSSSTTSFTTTLVADGAGNIYGCDPTGANLDVFNSGATTAPTNLQVNSYTITTQRACGSQLVLDGQGRIFAVLDNGSEYPITNYIANIDEFTTAGKLISPVANGYTGSSSAEKPTLNVDASYNTAPSVNGIGAAIDGSGNLWVLNPSTNGTDITGSTPQSGNVLVEYVGIGAPVVTPTSVALKNGMLGARP